MFTVRCAFKILISDTALDNHVVWTFVFSRRGFTSFFEEIHGFVVSWPACHHIWWNNCRLCDELPGTRILQVFDSFFELLFDVGMNAIHTQFLFHEERSWDFELGVVNEGVVANPDSMRWREIEMSFFHRSWKRDFRQDDICHHYGLVILRFSYRPLKPIRTLSLRVGIFNEGFQSIPRFLILF